VRLAAERLAPPPRRSRGGRLVLIHGFTQTRSSWSEIAAKLNRDGYEVISVDAPGHGESGALHVDLPTGAAALGGTGERATYIGYSMGGRLALHLAVARPDLVERLVLVSSTAGLDDDADRAARRADDERRAAFLEDHGVAAFLADWLALPLFANLRRDDAQLADRRGNTAAGLAASLRLAGTGAQQSLWPRLDSLAMPVLLVTGMLDAKFTSIAERMAWSIPRATVATLAGAGHVVHLGQPARFLVALRPWLDANPDARRAPSVGPSTDRQADRRQGAEGQL
jgi:2-succinyl-6-hydroxy-2,4-cyclohexadiene-1-carboxylate synthase